MTKHTKLTRIIMEGVSGETVSGEAPVKHKRRKRLSVEFYRKRTRKGWATRKRLADARAAANQEEAA